MAPNDGTASQQEQLRLVGGALALSAHVASRDPGQLGVQMVGRLLEGELPHLQRLRATALGKLALWPLLPGLTPPVGPQVRMIGVASDFSGRRIIVQALSVLPNGRTAVVGRDDGTITATDIDTGAARWSSPPASPIVSLAVSPSRGWIIAGGEDGSVRLLDPASGADLGQLGRHGREANRVAVSADASRAVTLSPDGDLRIWDLDTRREVGRLSGAGPFALAPTGGSLYSVVGGTLRSWDLTTLRPGPPVAVDQVGILATAIAPDGARLVTVQHLEGYAPGHPETSLNRVELTVHDLHTGRAPLSAADTEPAVGVHQFSWACVTVSPDARLAVTGSLTGRVLIWDLERPASPLVMVGHTTQVLAAAFTPDGRQLLTGGRDGTVRVWDVARRAEVPHLAQHAGEVNGVAVTGDGSRAVSVASNGSVAVWGLLPRVIGRAVPCEVGRCWSLGISPRGDRAAIGSDGVAVVLDLQTGEEVARRALPAGRSGGPVLQAGFSPDDLGIWAIDASGNRVEWEIARDRVRAGPEPTGASPLFGLAFTQDGACWIGGTPDGEVVARARGRSAGPFGERRHRGRVRSAAISADGRWALTGDAQGQIVRWDLEQQRSTGAWQGHRSTVMALSITPDGRRAASAAFDGTLALWDLAASRRLASFTADGGLIAVALSADGRICVAGEQSGRVHALMSVADAGAPGSDAAGLPAR